MSDLDPAGVQRDLARLVGASHQRTAPWQTDLSDPAARAGVPFQPFNPGPVDPLTPVKDVLSSAMNAPVDERDVVQRYLKRDASPLERGLFSFARGAGYAVSNPITTVLDTGALGMADAINRAQADFVAKHEGDLQDLSLDMLGARAGISEMAALLKKTNFSPAGLNRIMAEKAALGRDLLMKLNDAIDKTDDPDQRERLQSLKDDLEGWRNDGDTRLKNEQPAVNDLSKRMSDVQGRILEQRRSMDSTADASYPRNRSEMSIDEWVKLGHPATLHTSSEAIPFAIHLKSFLLGARAQLDGALSGK